MAVKTADIDRRHRTLDTPRFSHKQSISGGMVVSGHFAPFDDLDEKNTVAPSTDGFELMVASIPGAPDRLDVNAIEMAQPEIHIPGKSAFSRPIRMTPGTNFGGGTPADCNLRSV